MTSSHTGTTGTSTDGRDRANRAAAIAWAQDLLADPDTCFFDLESTGLGRDRPAFAVQAAVVDRHGNKLFEAPRIDPRHLVEPDAADKHGLTNEALTGAPAFAMVWPKLRTALEGRRVVVYSQRMFDRQILAYEMDRLQPPPGTALDGLRFVDAMEPYAALVGEPHPEGGYRWRPLGGPHNALADCQALRRRVERMAAGLDDEANR